MPIHVPFFIGRTSRRWFELRLGLAAVCLIATIAASASAQQKAGREPKRDYPIKQAIDADVAAVENELAGLMQFRGDMPPDQAGRLELLIDLRVVARWLLIKAADAPKESDAQMCAVLRADELLATAKTVTDLFKTLPKPTPEQNDAMAKLHALTFTLADVKGNKSVDDLCQQIGGYLAVAAGPLPPQLPLMRPSVAVRPPATGPAAPRAPQVDPLSRANLLTVSAPLKRQVVALATAAAAAQAAPESQKEAASLNAPLLRVLEVCEGLASNTAVGPAGRQELERKLIEALPMYLDPRVRSVGQQRLSAIDDYAKTIGRIRRLNLKPELYSRLGSLLSRAGDDPANGAKLMNAVETYLVACAKLDARRSAPPAALPPREAKLVADAIQKAATAREQFLVDAASRGLADPAVLTGSVDTMTQSLASADSYERVPRAMQTLLAYKPRPTSALERRAAIALAALADAKASPARDDATKALAEIVRLAELANEFDTMPAVSADVARDYARGQLGAFDARRRDLISDLASQIATNKPMDSQMLARLHQMKLIRKSLGEAAALEAATAKAALLARWVDWTVNPDDLKSALEPYRVSMASVIGVFAADAAVITESWPTVQARYAPLVKLVVHVSGSADDCAGFPEGLAGHAARLMTPLESQPYAPERFGAVSVKLWSRFGQANDEGAVKAIAEALDKRF